MRLVVVGGSDAGIAAALRARELDPGGEVTVLVADAYPNYSICGLPYLLSGDVPTVDALAHRTRRDLEHTGMQLRLGCHATRIDTLGRRVLHDGGELSYDELIVATGAVPQRPRLPGLDLPDVHVLHTIDDALALDRTIEDRQPARAVIIGAGYIGLEMAEALTQRGLRVTVIEQAAEVLPTVDPELGARVHRELSRHDVHVITETAVTAIEPEADGLRVGGADRELAVAELVLLVVGVRPDTVLAQTAGVELGARGAVRVDRRMATSVPHVWAAGDCVHTHHVLLDEPTYLPLGTTAHKQGRVAAENALGGDRRYAGSLGTQVVKVFELAVARTGLRDADAAAAGFQPVTVAAAAPDHTPYYPAAHEIAMRFTADAATGQLLGCQLVGHRDAEIPKRIDVVAAALHAGWSIDQLNELDLSYTPPFGTPWDALQAGAQAWEAAGWAG